MPLDFMIQEAQGVVDDVNALGFYKPQQLPWAIVNIAHQAHTSETEDGDTIVLAGKGQFWYRTKPYVPELDETSEQYNPEAAPFDMSAESFKPTKQFSMLMFSVGINRIKFGETDKRKVECFSKDGKYPDKDNPYSDTCADCPLAQIGVPASIRCNIQPSILGLDSEMRPVVLQLTVSSMQDYRQFTSDMAEVAREWKAQGKTWVPFLNMVTFSTKEEHSDKNGADYYKCVFPTLETLKSMEPLDEGILQQVYDVMVPIRSKWSPKYMPPGERVLGKKVDPPSIGGVVDGVGVPERKALGDSGVTPRFNRLAAPKVSSDTLAKEADANNPF